MKTLGKILLAVVVVALVGCTKNDYSNSGTSLQQVFRVTSQINGGYAGGETEFGAGGLTSNATNFLSQYPLKDFIYQENITYDSIVDISGGITFQIINRDTIGFYTDSKWLPFDRWEEPHLLNLYIGVSSELELQSGITLEIQSTGNMEPGFDLSVFMPDSLSLAQRLQVFNGKNSERHTFRSDEPLTLIEGEHYTIKPDVPVYNAQGLIESTQFGIELEPIVFFQQLVTSINNIVPENRAFIVSVVINGQKITSAFTIRFVEEQTYIDRQCWLEQKFECKDLFDE